MKKKIILMLIVLLPLIAMAYDFEDGGVRNAALGNAGISSAEDASAAVVNPALLGFMKRYSIITDTRHYSIQLDNDEIGQNFTYFAMPFDKIGTIAFTGGLFNSDAYSEGKFGFHLGRMILGEKLGIGLGMKTFYTNFSELDKNKMAFDMDFGLAYQLNNYFKFGLNAKNLLATDMGIENEDKVPREFGFGITSKFGRYTFTGDIKHRDDYDAKTYFSIGSEVNFADNFDIRLGMNNSHYTTGFGLKIYERSTLLRFNKKTDLMADVKSFVIHLDYAFQYPLNFSSGDNIGNDLETEYGNHYFGLRFDFGGAKADKEKLMKLFPSKFARFGEADTVFVEKVKIDTVLKQVTIRDTIKIVQKELDEGKLRRMLDKEYKVMQENEFKKINRAADHLTKSLEFYYTGDYMKAIQECETAIELAPDLALAYIRLGSIYYKLGNIEEAIYYWEQALYIDPDNQKIKDLLQSEEKSVDDYLPEY